ncbi:alpha/beta fold hydrolase [Agrobacterium tumefaciens]|nr:alpha/beta fold hydrolase [Agrobacterium tumefaciens]
MSNGHHTFSLGDLVLRSGAVLPEARLGYRTWGELNERANNVILLPSYYTGTSGSHASMIGKGLAFDPSHYFVVAIDLFGNGHSTSPSNFGRHASDFPMVSVADNVDAQRQLLSSLGIARIKLIYGWSLAAIQAHHWAVMYPDAVDAYVAVCGASGC